MTYWIFQKEPEKNDLNTAGTSKTTLSATQHRNRMSEDDIVFLLERNPEEDRGTDQGVKEGIVGWGKIVGAPYPKPDMGSFVVDVEMEKRFDRPISVEDVKKTRNLKHLPVLRAPEISNYRLEPDEANEILNMIKPNDRPKIRR